MSYYTAMMKELLSALQPILDAISLAGGTPLVVGGAVRDVLLGLTPSDCDIEVYGLTPDALATAVAPLGRVDAVGRSFGVIKLRQPGGAEIDLAVPQRRSINLAGTIGSLPEPDPGLTPREACARRDFTWNAIAVTADGTVLDFFGGQATGKRRVVTGKILEQRRERILDPGVRALVDPEHLVAVLDQAQREVGADLAGRSCDENAHQPNPDGWM